MEVTAWNNGQYAVSGAGYGLRVEQADRDRYFDKDWQIVWIVLPGVADEIKVHIDASTFWSDSSGELLNQRIGQWLIENGYAQWKRRKPPRFFLDADENARFTLRIINAD